MLSRALVVLLLVLNLGVAAWIVLRPGTPAAVMPAATPGVPTLQLLAPAARAVPADGGPASTLVAARPQAPLPDDGAAMPLPAAAGAPVASATLASAPAPAPDPQRVAVAPSRCFAAGPYADAAAAAADRPRLLGAGASAAVARTETLAARGWRVMIAPQPTRDAAVALAERLRTDGFDDLLVVNDGPEANAIALGRYRGESAARQREAALRARSYPASAQPIGDAPARFWLDLTAADGVGDAALRAVAAAPLQPRPCTGG